MKTILSLFVFVLCLQATAQQHVCAKSKQSSAGFLINNQNKSISASPFISHEYKYDVKFVTLDLKVERTSTYIKGSVLTVATVTAAALDTFMTLLHQAHTIDSMRFNGALVVCTRIDSIVKAKIPSPLLNGATFTVLIHYNGTAPNSAGSVGGGFCQDSVGWYNNAAVWSLSQPFGAYEWWPCKQILTDKVDSSRVIVTTDSSNKVGSNGILKKCIDTGKQKKI